MKGFQQFLREASGGWERVQYSDSDRSFQTMSSPDEYFYHVTLTPNAQSIMRSGELKPKSKLGQGLMGRFGEHHNSVGRVFLTDRNGVFFWVEKAEQHADNYYDDPPDVAVIRVLKSRVPTATPDDVGTRDAHAPAYYVAGGFKV